MNDDAYSVLLKVLDQLNKAIGEYRKNIDKRNEAANNYRKEYAKKIIELEATGKAKTLIKELANGDEHVSDLCFARDTADGVVEANREFINIKKIEANALKELISKEYYNG